MTWNIETSFNRLPKNKIARGSKPKSCTPAEWPMKLNKRMTGSPETKLQSSFDVCLRHARSKALFNQIVLCMILAAGVMFVVLLSLI